MGYTALEEKSLQERFLETFVESHGDSAESLKSTGIPRKTFFRWLEQDRAFRDRFDGYRIRLSEDIENEAVRRILKGKGQKGSDQLLMKTLAGLKPDRYRETTTGNDNRTVIYVSGVRDTPRIGIKEGENDPAAIGPDRAGQEFPNLQEQLGTDESPVDVPVLAVPDRVHPGDGRD